MLTAWVSEGGTGSSVGTIPVDNPPWWFEGKDPQVIFQARLLRERMV